MVYCVIACANALCMFNRCAPECKTCDDDIRYDETEPHQKEITRCFDVHVLMPCFLSPPCVTSFCHSVTSCFLNRLSRPFTLSLVVSFLLVYFSCVHESKHLTHSPTLPVASVVIESTEYADKPDLSAWV